MICELVGGELTYWMEVGDDCEASNGRMLRVFLLNWFSFGNYWLSRGRLP